MTALVDVALTLAVLALVAWGDPSIHRSLILIAVLVVPALEQGRGGHANAALRSPKARLAGLLGVWCIAVLLGAAATSLVDRDQPVLPREAAVVFAAGLTAMLASRAIVAAAARTLAARGSLMLGSVFLVGDDVTVQECAARCDLRRRGLALAGGFRLRPGAATMTEDLALAAAQAHFRNPDAVYLVLPWDDRDRIARCVAALGDIRGSIWLAGGPDGSSADIPLILRPRRRFPVRGRFAVRSTMA